MSINLLPLPGSVQLTPVTQIVLEKRHPGSDDRTGAKVPKGKTTTSRTDSAGYTETMLQISLTKTGDFCIQWQLQFEVFRFVPDFEKTPTPSGLFIGVYRYLPKTENAMLELRAIFPSLVRHTISEGRWPL